MVGITRSVVIVLFNSLHERPNASSLNFFVQQCNLQSSHACLHQIAPTFELLQYLTLVRYRYNVTQWPAHPSWFQSKLVETMWKIHTNLPQHTVDRVSPPLPELDLAGPGVSAALKERLLETSEACRNALAQPVGVIQEDNIFWGFNSLNMWVCIGNVTCNATTGCCFFVWTAFGMCLLPRDFHFYIVD